MAPHPTSSEFSLVSLFKCPQVCWHFRPKSSPPCDQVCVWPPLWSFGVAGRGLWYAGQTVSSSWQLCERALQHSVRCFKMHWLYLAGERANQTVLIWWRLCKCQGRWHSSGLGELTPSARYSHLGLSQAGSYTPKSYIPTLYQGQRAIPLRAYHSVSPWQLQTKN